MLSGYSLGYLSMAVSPYCFVKTIEYVEEFVVQHYNKQIKLMDDSSTPNLRKVLQSFCDDENEHRKQGLEFAQHLDSRKDNQCKSMEYPIWKSVVQNGSDYATLISKYCKGYK